MIPLFFLLSSALSLVFANPPATDSSQHLSAADLIDFSVQKQRDFCANPERHRDPESENKLKLSRGRFVDHEVRMYLYKSTDIVSQCIDQQGVWENTETQLFYNAIMHQMQRKHIAEPRSAAILDIGAQIGWYSLGLATKGFKVIAFEPMRYNMYMIRKSHCLYSNLDLTLVEKALGPESMQCNLYADSHNIGDPHVFCRGNAVDPQLVNLGPADVYKLDDFADYLSRGNLLAVKMDIEGFEHNVMKGGQKVLLDMHVPVIMSEFSIGMMEGKGGNPRQYLEMYERAGYKLSTSGFGQSILTVDQVMEETRRRVIVNLYLLHSSAM